MNDKIKDIAEKFIATEKIPQHTAMLMASLGLSKNVGDIADIAYGINFNKYPLTEDRKNQIADCLGYIMLNWQILATITGLSGDEIADRFTAEWLTKHNSSKASIKDLLKHLKSPLKQETPTQEQQVKREPTKVEFTRQV